MNLGRANLAWSTDNWNGVDDAVHNEVLRVEVARKFMPVYMTTSDARYVPADTVDTTDPQTLTVDESAQISIFEISVGFALTQQQVELVTEGDMSTVTTLATRAANILGGAKDELIWKGDRALTEDLFTSKRVNHRNSSFGKDGKGLLDLAEETIEVPFAEGGPPDSYGENTFAKVAEVWALCDCVSHYSIREGL
jgi:uncharacterized linocin/CFP29 family protein